LTNLNDDAKAGNGTEDRLGISNASSPSLLLAEEGVE
jgi:hypothetical protein